MAEELTKYTSEICPTENVRNEDIINSKTFQNMISMIESLLNHTHTMVDDYGTACNCNCNCKCNCTRGIL